MTAELFSAFGESATYGGATSCTVVRLTQSDAVGMYGESATLMPLVLFNRSEVTPVAGAALVIGAETFTLGPRHIGGMTDEYVVAHVLE